VRISGMIFFFFIILKKAILYHQQSFSMPQNTWINQYNAKNTSYYKKF
jgi:hypothetical protein